MTIHIARLRALHIGMLAASCLLALGGTARADDTTPTAPRAVPLGRALPRSYPSYDALITTASAVAADQTALWAQLAATSVEEDQAKAILASIFDPRLRGGLVHAESNVSDEQTIRAVRANVASIQSAEAQLVAGGATPVAPAPTWVRPLAGEVSQPFGPTTLRLEPARLYKGAFFWHFHDGVDILAPAGTPIVAPARGRVVFAGRMMDGAVVVVLAHDNGLTSLFAHLDGGPLVPTIKAGDIVQAGDRIGAVGLTGLTTGFHLHWAVYRNGEPIDPLSTLGG